MNTDPKVKDLLRQIFVKLDVSTAVLSVDQLISELQVVVERMSFSGLHKTFKKGDAAALAEIDLMFEGEISMPILSFVYWLADNDGLSVLADKTGHFFLDTCIKRYKSITEIRFATAIELTDETKQSIVHDLYKVYQEPSRVIFEVIPSIVAGFIIRDGAKVIDKSLKTMSTQAIKKYLTNEYNQMAVNHG